MVKSGRSSVTLGGVGIVGSVGKTGSVAGTVSAGTVGTAGSVGTVGSVAGTVSAGRVGTAGFVGSAGIVGVVAGMVTLGSVGTADPVGDVGFVTGIVAGASSDFGAVGAGVVEDGAELEGRQPGSNTAFAISSSNSTAAVQRRTEKCFVRPVFGILYLCCITLILLCSYIFDS